MTTKTSQQEMMSKLLPNTFPFANMLMDELDQLSGCNIWSLLDPVEHTLLPIVYRKTFGWWKRSDRIAMSQLKSMSGLNEATVRKYMNSLVELGLVVKIDNNNSANEGIEWSPQTDDKLINFDALLERTRLREEVNAKRMNKVRSKRVLLSHNSTLMPQGRGTVMRQGRGTVIAQGTQKPIKAKESKGRTFRDPMWDILHGENPDGQAALALEQEKQAIEAFESAFHLQRPWNWYPSGKDEKTWRDFRAYVVELLVKDPQCFTKYVTWSMQPFVKGSMTALSIKRSPEQFPDSWSAYLVSPMYAELNDEQQEGEEDEIPTHRVV